MKSRLEKENKKKFLRIKQLFKNMKNLEVK